MFKKIVSGLPFSPSMVAQLGSYSKQLEKERRLRLLGLVFAVIITTVQLTYLFTFSFFNLSLSKESVFFKFTNLCLNILRIFIIYYLQRLYR
jgi:hypothetical protein